MIKKYKYNKWDIYYRYYYNNVVEIIEIRDIVDKRKHIYTYEYNRYDSGRVYIENKFKNLSTLIKKLLKNPGEYKLITEEEKKNIIENNTII